MMFLSLVLLAASYARPEAVVTTEWLAAHLGDPGIRIVDTRTKGYEDGHIPGAVWLDIDASRDKLNPPTFLPELDTFVSKLEELGISNNTRVIFYDDRGGIYGTRPWVLLRVLGHDNAAVLDGGWPKWLHEARTTSVESTRVTRGDFDPELDSSWIVTADDVVELMGDDGAQLVDTRTADEYVGQDLRGNPRGGAIPGAANLDWESTLSGEFQTFRSADELRTLFDSHGISRNGEIVTYCQGGGRAAHELFVLYLMGYDKLRLYLGSMEDWSRRPELPLAR